MTSRIAHTCFDCAEPYRLAEFWSKVLDLPVDPDDGPESDEVSIGSSEQDEMVFQRVPERKTVKNRMHVCLTPEQLRDAEVERVLALGASLLADRRSPDGTGWVVLGDPEGNEFCVLRSDAERAVTATAEAD